MLSLNPRNPFPFRCALMAAVFLTITGFFIPLSGQVLKAGLGKPGRAEPSLREQREEKPLQVLSLERISGIKSLELPSAEDTGLQRHGIIPSYLNAGHTSLYAVPAFEVVTLQHLSFGKFRVGPAGGKMVVQPSGGVEVHGDMVSLDHRAAPAIFEILTDSLLWLEVHLPGSFHLAAYGEGTLSARPWTNFGRGPIMLELKPRPYRNYLQVGGELQLTAGRAAAGGDFSGSMHIEFRPVMPPFFPGFPIR